jgi:hypothetical protein
MTNTDTQAKCNRQTWPYKPAIQPPPNIWQGKCGEWYSRCPICQASRSHKTKGIAIDKANNLCRKCRIERGSDYWAMLRLLRQENAREANYAMEDNTTL